ncbi:hypothetical protein [Geodermatophilus sp. DSM 44513]|uniref:hypothetical protein n=1 Tax=Geodermatophilus sp. DSM 44513 TaxID=1528104 RepID=UPI001284658E|nr:hypothetical protein [Geodermatophilus sp. DSM 44513]WNV77693.1 hypothetical protein RTG05_10565 [Geodermatophilus sp. DSM 44513]
MESEDAGRTAAQRAAAAGRRSDELAERLARLSAGERPDTESVRDARAQAEAAAEHARESAERARLGHQRAARVHERTAQAHEAAARAGVGDVVAHRSRAEDHPLRGRRGPGGRRGGRRPSLARGGAR